VHAEEIEADALIHVVVKHSTNLHDPDGRLVFCRQAHFGHWPAFVKIQHVREGLIVAPEDRAGIGDAFHRPAIVLSVEDGIAHGSCRSFSRFDMLAALERCAHLLTRFGGHKQAAGLTLDAARVRELRLAVNEVADETLGPEDLMPRLKIDGTLTFRGITGGVAAGVASLAPFGAGNPRPVFAARGVEIIDGPRKLKERHLKMSLKQDGRIFRAVAWRAAERHEFLSGHKAGLDVAFSLEQNQYNGETYVELTLADLKSSET